MIESNSPSNLSNLSDKAISALKKVCFHKLSALEGKLLPTLIFETYVIRFQIYLKKSLNQHGKPTNQ